MKIIAKMFECNYKTYQNVYQDAIKRAYQKDGVNIDSSNIEIEKILLPGNTVQAKRSNQKHTRTISVFEDGILKYIIGFSNTNFDEDKKQEVEENGGKYVYGTKHYHSNTYLFQGLNKVIQYYYEEKKEHEQVKFFLYLLDVKELYANSLSCLMNYRKLATIGFEILNLDQISFEKYKPLGFDYEKENIYYTSFQKLVNDISYLSRKNIGNMPSYLQCIDENYSITKYQKYDNQNFSPTQKYIYTFKTLSAEGYDSFFTIWTLMKLAKKEQKILEFEVEPQDYHFQFGEQHYLQSKKFTQPVLELLEIVKLDIKYETVDEVRKQKNRLQRQYETAYKKGEIRNQELFKNNMRKKGLQTKCYLCGCEMETILEAAHLWGVANIKHALDEEILEVASKPAMTDLFDRKDPHYEEIFYKTYMLANSGDNGIWLCKNHHGLFDSHYYCFDSDLGKVLVTIEEGPYFKTITNFDRLPKFILTPKTKLFLQERKSVFEQKKLHQVS